MGNENETNTRLSQEDDRLTSEEAILASNTRKGVTPADESVHGVDTPEHMGAQMSASEAHDVSRNNDTGQWTRPDVLNAPPCRPGFVQRWINHVDQKNFRRRIREGWNPRPADSVETVDSLPPSLQMKLADFGNCIGDGDVILCEMPERVNDQRNAYHQKRLERQNQSIVRNLKDAEDPALAIEQERKSSVEAPSRPTQVMPD